MGSSDRIVLAHYLFQKLCLRFSLQNASHLTSSERFQNKLLCFTPFALLRHLNEFWCMVKDRSGLVQRRVFLNTILAGIRIRPSLCAFTPFYSGETFQNLVVTCRRLFYYFTSKITGAIFYLNSTSIISLIFKLKMVYLMTELICS